MGRFLTPDPYKAGSGSGDPANPQSWNRYAYAGGDPINGNDPQGLQTCKFNGEEDYQPGCLGANNPGGGQIPPHIAGTITETCDEHPEQCVAKTNLDLRLADKTQKGTFNSAVTAAEKLLNKSGDCAGLFGGTADSAIGALEGATYNYNAIPNEDATGVLGENYWAVTNPGTRTVTINLFGHFFDVASSTWLGVTLNGTQTRELVLLHELGT
jgi:hypothetical protein